MPSCAICFSRANGERNPRTGCGLGCATRGEGEALRIARSTAAQITKYDAVTRAAAKKFIKPIPHEELRREIDLSANCLPVPPSWTH